MVSIMAKTSRKSSAPVGIPEVIAGRFGQKLREMRLAREWSQAELAQRSQSLQKTISGYESGHLAYPTYLNLIRLAQAFGCSLDEFAS